MGGLEFAEGARGVLEGPTGDSAAPPLRPPSLQRKAWDRSEEASPDVSDPAAELSVAGTTPPPHRRGSAAARGDRWLRRSGARES